MIDLHIHSTASDGTLSPTSLAQAGQRAGLAAMALTDHDTVSGLPEFMAAGRNCHLQTVPGVEIACSWYSFSVHLVGLFIDYTNPGLLALLSQIRQARDKRNQLILQRLQELGIKLSMADIVAETGSCNQGVLGRPHFARALVRGQYCQDHQHAFNSLLGRQGKAHVQSYLPLPAAAIAAIHAAGGVAVLAHPFGGVSDSGRARLRHKLQRLKTMGLDGVEVLYSDYSPEQQAAAASLAGELSLLPSGGTDFHGDNSPEVMIGHGLGNLQVPNQILPLLQKKAEEYR